MLFTKCSGKRKQGTVRSSETIDPTDLTGIDKEIYTLFQTLGSGSKRKYLKKLKQLSKQK